MTGGHNETVRQILGTPLWVRMRAMSALRWLRRCPECSTRPDRQWQSLAPRWDADPVAVMLGALNGRCGRCGAEVVR